MNSQAKYGTINKEFTSKRRRIMLDFAKDPKFWERVRTSKDYAWQVEEIKEIYKRAFQTPPRPHTAKEILENNDNGHWRLQFDHLQSSFLLSLIYPDNEEYYNSLIDTVWAYLNEYSWAPIGHYSEYYYQRTPQDFDCGLIDIFASSVAFSLAEINHLFKGRFPKLLTDRISYELRRRTIEPYLTRRFFWETHDNNWTAVCAGGVGGVLIYEAPELYYQCKERIHASMKCYLDSYKEDGMCVEGVGYWAFGFGFFASFALLEKELTNGEVDWFKDEKVIEIAKFLQKTFLQKNVLVTYGDCSVKQDYQTGLPHMLKYIYGDIIESLPRELAYVGKHNTHPNFLLRSILYHNSDYYSDTLPTNVTYTASNSAYIVKRTDTYGFSAKGGNNGESHNHIDVGTFILARNNQQIICDIGAGEYLEGYHGDKRYTFFHPSSYAHSLPIINTEGQCQKKQEDVIITYDDKTSTASMDIGVAYKLDYLKGLKRSFNFTNEALTLTDKYTLTSEAEIIERFISLIEPRVNGTSLVIDDVVLENDYGITPEISIKEVKAHMSQVGSHNVYMIDYKLQKNQTEFTLKFKMPQ